MSIKDSVLAYFSAKKSLSGSEQEKLACRYLDQGVIDSMGIVELMNHFEEQYEIRFEADDLQSDEFQSIGGLVKIIERLSGRK
jgi:acyl carrier protein